MGDDAQAVRITLTSGGATDVGLAVVDAPSTPAPDGSAGALDVLPTVDGPERFLFAGALFASALLLALVAFGWSPWRSRRMRRVGAVVLVAWTLAACVPATATGTSGAEHAADLTRAGISRASSGPFACAGGPEYAPALKFAVVHHTVNSNSYTPH